MFYLVNGAVLLLRSFDRSIENQNKGLAKHLTRFGLPVSTTFLILTFFAPKNLASMVTKSLLGYGLALAVGLITFKLVKNYLAHQKSKTVVDPWWVPLQWITTAFLWSQWLIQDLANIFVYVPRQVPFSFLLFAITVFVVLLAVILYQRGGAIQKIVDTKTGVTDIRAATIIDFMYALILLVFKEWSNIPMSTTWVFLGLLAGREFAMSMIFDEVNKHRTSRNVSKDAMKLMFGLAMSVILATTLPWFYNFVTHYGQ